MTDGKPAADEPAGGLSSCAEPGRDGSQAEPRRIKARADFLRAARARTVRMPGFMLQARDRRDEGAIRVGFTCSRKVGNAVARNRAKRRLREIARIGLPHLGQSGWDYVLIGKRDVTAERNFERMQADLNAALRKIHG
ncbi:ribonuclease P protein component [Palleronia sp. LCG004]|uniref:ribonuclease P protein component n=1 Tax=Palleronia sp. LCG004 TaxID=3079304 RepID=UPI002943EB24|nr:ribonuclease P protein component [Palleronia sp. LCG004]WOI56546.1 ribonuclease P protein component [Palleronia sp. LCG004]